MSQRDLFPSNYPIILEHNTILIIEYYTKLQHEYYTHIANSHFLPEQNRDLRFITPPMIISLAHISIQECNPEKAIITNKDTIQIKNEQTHLYENTCGYLITIPTTRQRWLWQQYNTSNYSSHGPKPQTQSFENKVIWLYQIYKHKIPPKNPQKTTQHILSINIIDSIYTTFNIFHSYFSSPVTYSTQISKFYSPFAKNKVFGSLSNTFQYK